MATRDENLKKINMELEQMSDEELDQVAGGRTHETADDSRFLNVLLRGRPEQCGRYGEATVLFAGITDFETKAIKDAWNAVGIKADIYSGFLGSNKYYLNGKQISRSEAWAHAESVVGKHLSESDWNW